jgi:hypothetical protein
MVGKGFRKAAGPLEESGVRAVGLRAGSSSSRLLQSRRHAGYLADAPAASRYECVFVETQDGRLAKGGPCLSIRRIGGGAAWHLSGPEEESQGPFEGHVTFRSISPNSVNVPSVVREFGIRVAGGLPSDPSPPIRVLAGIEPGPPVRKHSLHPLRGSG